MANLFSYVLRYDDGAAPNPFHGVCTLAICKPKIRRTANIGDWVVGLASKRAFPIGYVVYAMKVTDKKTLKEYDDFCTSDLPGKIPNWTSDDSCLRAGDCIYDYHGRDESNPRMRDSVHKFMELFLRPRDLNGKYALLSKNFYYFGSKPKKLLDYLEAIIKKNQGHKRIENEELILLFEKWLEQNEDDRYHLEPQRPVAPNSKNKKSCNGC